MDDEKVISALKEACEKCGGQVLLSKISGVSQGQISDYLCGRRKIANMTLGTLYKLFPELEMLFFKAKALSSEPVLDEIIDIVMNLDPQEKAKCLKILAANFPEQILKETKNNV